MLKAANPPNANFPGLSQAVIIRAGNLMVTSGHVPTDDKGELVTGNFEEQAVAAFENLARTLKSAGVGFDSVARLTTFVTDYEPSMIDTLRAVRSRYITGNVPPASVVIAAAALYDPRIRIEIEAIAAVPQG